MAVCLRTHGPLCSRLVMMPKKLHYALPVEVKHVSKIGRVAGGTIKSKKGTVLRPGGELEIEYEHNDYGQLTRVKSLRGVDVTYLYDALGNLKVVKSKGFSENGDSNEIVAYSYNSIGRRTGITHPNGATVSYTHDYRGNIDTITHEKDATELLFLDYTRDGRGLVTDLLEKRNGESDVTWSYTYDAQKRLDGATRAVTGGGSTTYDYVYDDASNRTGKSVTGSDPITYTYNSLDQLISDGTTTYIYDEFGNLEYEKEGETTKRRYFWDSENRLTKVELYNPDHTVVFGYDDNGTRVSRKYDDDPASRYLTDYYNLTGYSQTLSELDESYTKVSRNYFHGQELLTQRTPGEGLDYLDPENPSNDQLAYFHSDHLGSTRLLTDGDGSAINNSAFNYSPYGELLNGTSSLTSYHFTGQYLDTALNLQYHRARWYNTTLANWLSVDPVFDFPANFGNVYGYVGCNPLNLQDPTGAFTIADCLSAVNTLINLALISWTAYDISRVWWQWAKGESSLIDVGLRMAIYLAGGFLLRLATKFGLIYRFIKGTTVIRSRPLLSRFGKLNAAYRELLTHYGRKSGKVAEDFIRTFYGKTFPFSRIRAVKYSHIVPDLGRRIPDLNFRWLLGAGRAVEVKHWTRKGAEIVLRNERLWKQTERQLMKDAAILNKRSVNRIEWHFTRGDIPEEFIKRAAKIFKEKQVKIHIFDWGRL